jgi:hypothetical protein
MLRDAMNEVPSANRFIKPLLIGLGLAALGIGLFLTLYFDLQTVDPLPRLLVAMCVPPLIIAVLVGGYALYTGRFSSNKKSES